MSKKPSLAVVGATGAGGTRESLRSWGAPFNTTDTIFSAFKFA